MTFPYLGVEEFNVGELYSKITRYCILSKNLRKGNIKNNIYKYFNSYTQVSNLCT